MVKFNLLDEDTWETIESEPERSFYRVLPIAPQIGRGRTIGSSTLLWWINQIKTGHPDAASIFSPLPQRLDMQLGGKFEPDVEATLLRHLCDMTGWLDEDMYGWGKPAHFDLPKMDSLFSTFGMEFPIPWYMYRCMSSVRAAAKVFETPDPKFKTKGNVEHHALWDATSQVLELQGWFHNMRR